MASSPPMTDFAGSSLESSLENASTGKLAYLPDRVLIGLSTPTCATIKGKPSPMTTGSISTSQHVRGCIYVALTRFLRRSVEKRGLRPVFRVHCVGEGGRRRPPPTPPLAVFVQALLSKLRLCLYFNYILFIVFFACTAKKHLQDGEWQRILRLAIVTGEEGPICAILRACPSLLLQVRREAAVSPRPMANFAGPRSIKVPNEKTSFTKLCSQSHSYAFLLFLCFSKARCSQRAGKRTPTSCFDI